jgi:Tfp pilus assembly protein PilV
VICILLVISIGLMGVVGLAAYAMALANTAQNSTTGMATAISVAGDAQPLLDPAVAASWDYHGYDMNDTATPAQTVTTAGYINGYYVVRTETSLASDPSGYTDIIAQDPATHTVYVRSAAVTVQVYDTLGGALVTTYTTRLLRQQGAP